MIVFAVVNAGVRSLERRLAAICRHVAVDIVEHRDRKPSTTEVLHYSHCKAVHHNVVLARSLSSIAREL